MTRWTRALVVGGLALVGLYGAVGSAAGVAGSGIDPSVRQPFHEPVVLASKDGVLEVTLTAHQGRATLDTVAKPVENLLVFAYRVVRGTASNGEVSGDDL